MIREFEKAMPQTDSKSFIAETAAVIGKVSLGEYGSIWYGTVVRGDVNSISIGRYSNIQDNSVIHVADDYPAVIGDYVTVGHNAVIHAATIEDHVLVGMSATVLDGAVVGRGSIIAAGAVVKKGEIIPPHSLVAGVPAKVLRTIPEELDKIHAQAIKYKTLWTERYGLLPNGGGERYGGERIV